MNLKVQVLVDNQNSWIIPYAYELRDILTSHGHNCDLIHSHDDIENGDILCLLACEKILKNRNANRYNLVVHESALPQGKGWSPVTWQVLEGKKRIPVSLIEAEDKVDSGVIYNQTFFLLQGHELIDEIREKQAKCSIDLIVDFVTKYPVNEVRTQRGQSSFYSRRRPEDSELNVNESIKSQFDLLRVCDNERYPAFFKIGGVKYYLQISKDKNE